MKIQNVIFCFLVCVVIVFKWQDLHLPFFWDELGVYSRSAQYLSDHSLSLLPSALPPELSRGHPLLLPFVYAVVILVFGDNVFVFHGLSLTFSLFLLLAVYHHVSRQWNRTFALSTVLLFAAQPVFLAQSSMVLPEIPLALLVFLALMNYQDSKYGRYALYASLAVLIKEVAIVLVILSVLHVAYRKFLKKDRWYSVSLSQMLLVLLPGFVFVLFFTVQRIQQGWFFFPYHVELLTLHPQNIWDAFSRYLSFLFLEQGRFVWLILILTAFVVFTLKQSWRLHYHKVFVPFLFAIAFLVFSAFNFYMNRYILVLLPWLSFALVISIFGVFTNQKWGLFICLLVSSSSLLYLKAEQFNYDVDLGYRDHLQLEKQLVGSLCNDLDSAATAYANFPLNVALVEKRSGLSVCEKLSAAYVFNLSTTYVLKTRNGGDLILPDSVQLIPKIHLKVGNEEGDLYEVKK